MVNDRCSNISRSCYCVGDTDQSSIWHQCITMVQALGEDAMEDEVIQLPIVQFTRLVGDLIRRSLAGLFVSRYPYSGHPPKARHRSTVARLEAIGGSIFLSRARATLSDFLGVSYHTFLEMSNIKFIYNHLILLYTHRLYSTIDSYPRENSIFVISRKERMLIGRRRKVIARRVKDDMRTMPRLDVRSRLPLHVLPRRPNELL